MSAAGPAASSSSSSSSSSSTRHRSGSSSVKTIELPVAQPRVGPCEGCGQPNVQLRHLTHEYLCSDCRDDLRFKLITKTTVMELYPLLTVPDLVAAVKAKRLRMFFTSNWHNRKAPPIKLYYECDVRRLCQEKERQSARQSRDRDRRGSSQTPSSSLRILKLK